MTKTELSDESMSEDERHVFLMGFFAGRLEVRLQRRFDCEIWQEARRLGPQATAGTTTPQHLRAHDFLVNRRPVSRMFTALA